MLFWVKRWPDSAARFVFGQMNSSRCDEEGWPGPRPLEVHQRYMRMALDEASACLRHGDVPVGAVVVSWRESPREGRVVGRGRNRREETGDPTAHAEIIAIRQAAATLGSWRLSDTTLYVTLEPCVMCAGASVMARIPELVYGADDPKAGACGSAVDVAREPRLNHRVRVIRGVLAEECSKVLEAFFRNLRLRARSGRGAGAAERARLENG